MYDTMLIPVLCSLMHIRNNRISNNPNGPQPMVVKVNGTTITIITPWDALSYLYTINFPLPKKDPKTKKMKFTYQSQVKFLFWHLDQICQWITIMEHRKRLLALLLVYQF